MSLSIPHMTAVTLDMLRSVAPLRYTKNSNAVYMKKFVQKNRKMFQMKNQMRSDFVKLQSSGWLRIELRWEN